MERMWCLNFTGADDDAKMNGEPLQGEVVMMDYKETNGDGKNMFQTWCRAFAMVCMISPVSLASSQYVVWWVFPRQAELALRCAGCYGRVRCARVSTQSVRFPFVAWCVADAWFVALFPGVHLGSFQRATNWTIFRSFSSRGVVNIAGLCALIHNKSRPLHELVRFGGSGPKWHLLWK